MKASFLSFVLFFPVLVFGQQQDFPKSFSVRVSNPSSIVRENVLVNITPALYGKKYPDFNAMAFIVKDGVTEIASQFNFSDKDFPGIVTVIERLLPRQNRTLTVYYNPQGVSKRNYTKRTQAELSHKFGGSFVNREYKGGEYKNVNYLRVPPEHKDHSRFIRYEGPGWESDKVAYRFYLDQRNATDVFGKRISEVVLQQVGLENAPSYHELQPWGMDVMKVGNSVGVGGIAYMQDGRAMRVEKTDSITCRIVENGPVFSSVRTRYIGWQTGDDKYLADSRISIHAGTRLTRQVLSFDKTISHIATGIVKDEKGKVFFYRGDKNKFGYLATYGKQSLNNDELGLLVFFDPSDYLDSSVDKDNHLVKLRPRDGKFQYYFGAAWVLEPDGIKNEKEFRDYLERVASELSKPLRISVR